MSTIGRPPKNKRSAFGERLQLFREQANLTQREIAHQLGISQPSYAKWERRDVGLTQDSLQQLSSILGVEVKDFFSTGDELKHAGPIGRVRKTFEKISLLSANRQKQILDVIDMLLHKE